MGYRRQSPDFTGFVKTGTLCALERAGKIKTANRKATTIMTTVKTIEINGAEGGGQILRAALSMSAALGIPFHIRNIRGKREKAGLGRQHLSSVRAAAAICGAEVTGAEMNSTELTFVPGEVQVGSYRFDIGTGGSTMLVLQAIVPALICSLKAGEKASVTVTGGTYCPFAPAFEFLKETLEPCLNRMGYPVTFTMPRPAFFQAAGGLVRMEAAGPFEPAPLEFRERGSLKSVSAVILNCHLPPEVAEREKKVLMRDFGDRLGLTEDAVTLDANPAIPEAGNAVLIRTGFESGTSVFSEIGRPRLAAESVAKIAADESAAFLEADVPVCRHLQDQLLVPMALAGGGHFVTTAPSAHTRTCAQVIQAFTGKPVHMDQQKHGWLITVPSV